MAKSCGRNRILSRFNELIDLMVILWLRHSRKLRHMGSFAWALALSIDTYFRRVRRHLPSPGTDSDLARLEIEASERQAHRNLQG